MRKPWYQKLITVFVPTAIAGVVVISSAIDIFNNLQFVTRQIAIVGTIIILSILFILRWSLQRNPLTWKTDDGNIIRIKSLGVVPYISAGSMIIALWLPQIINTASRIDLYTPKRKIDSNFTVVVARIDGSDSEKFAVTEMILASLQKKFNSDKEVKIIAVNDVVTEMDGSLVAQQLGEKYNADIVVWGWYALTSAKVVTAIHMDLVYPPVGIYLPTDTQILQIYSEPDEMMNFSLQSSIGSEVTVFAAIVSGLKKYQAGECKDAAITLEDSLLDYRSFGDPLAIANFYYFAGKCRFEISDFDAAISDFNESIKFNPSHASAFFELGNSYARLQEWNKAIDGYSKSIDTYPEYSPAYYNRGIVYKEIGNYQLAINDFVKCKNLSDDNALIQNVETQLRELGITP